jgi:hypothetical protein
VRPLARALSAAHSSDSGSRSVMQTSLAPQRAATMPGAPTPAPSSMTDLPATSSGRLAIRSASASPEGHGLAQKGSICFSPGEHFPEA